MSAPMLPPAPARFSTTNCWPKALESSGAIARARMSVVPPGAKGTTILTGLVGQLLCAAAGVAVKIIADNAQRISARRRFCSKESFKGGLRWVVGRSWRGTILRPCARLKRVNPGIKKAARRLPGGLERKLVRSVGKLAGSLDHGFELGDFGRHESLVGGGFDPLVGHHHGAQA